MSLPNINITVNTQGLGLVSPSADGTAVMVILTKNQAGLASVYAGVKLYTADDFDNDFTEAYDLANAEQVYFHLKQYFDAAGLAARLYVGFVADTATNAQIVTKAKEVYDFTQGECRLLGIAFNNAAPVTFNINATLGTIADQIANPIREHSEVAFAPLSILIEGYGIGTTDANVNAAVNLKGFSHPYLSVVVGTSFVGRPHSANVGMALGLLARAPVQRNIGRVKTGAATLLPTFVADNLITVSSAVATTLHDKGYITFRKYAGKQGFYITDDPTACPATNDLTNVTRNRVIDKMWRLAYAVYVEEIQDEINIDSVTGRIQPAQARYYEAIIESALNTSMTANGEVSDVSAEIDLAQNVLSTNELKIKVLATPVGYAKRIRINLGFKNPSLTL
jgi:Protein of unknown function (DUF2586)